MRHGVAVRASLRSATIACCAAFRKAFCPCADDLFCGSPAPAPHHAARSLARFVTLTDAETVAILTMLCNLRSPTLHDLKGLRMAIKTPGSGFKHCVPRCPTATAAVGKPAATEVRL